MNWLGGAKKRLRLMGCSSENLDAGGYKRKQPKLSGRAYNNFQTDFANTNEQDELFNRFYYKDQLLPKYLAN